MEVDHAHKLVHALNFLRFVNSVTPDAALGFAIALVWHRLAKEFRIGRTADGKFTLGGHANPFWKDEKDYDWIKTLDNALGEKLLAEIVARVDEPTVTQALIKATSQRLKGSA